MDRQTLLDFIAPCSLLCYSCPGLRGGAISQCAARLCGYFEGYYDFNDANLPEEYRGWLKEFDTFSRRLARYAAPRCAGCRNNPSPGAGCIEGCVVPDCAKARGADFCGECDEFPCRTAADFFARINQTIRKDWEAGSRRIRAVGASAYFDERKDVSHYISYKRAENA